MDYIESSYIPLPEIYLVEGVPVCILYAFKKLMSGIFEVTLQECHAQTSISTVMSCMGGNVPSWDSRECG